eukprot:TRINITY_DN4121_c0_g2_i1.p1 TRINITY_DN4121_c0_g2~~TRINITY_DN4121_c0_g2_i1.p1  ORF type:complete len:847 (-),score=121.79 TRINITY_DN4121_c0_g2_i1:219-2669(-)
MGLLRSEAMKHGTLVLPLHDARRYVDLIGKKLNVQFEDMNAKEMRRPYRKHVQRIDEMERILRFLTAELAQMDGCRIIKNQVDDFLENDALYSLDAVEAELHSLNKQVVKFKENNSLLMSERNQAQEEVEVTGRALTLLQAGGGAHSADLRVPLVADGELESRRLGSIAGVVAQTDEQRLRLALFRLSRGNVFVDTYPVAKELLDPKTGSPMRKSVFVVYFQGTGGASAPLHQKVVRLCQALGANLYAWPNNFASAHDRHSVLQAGLAEKNKALEGYMSVMSCEMQELAKPSRVGANSKIEDLRLFCIKEKAIYTILNMCTGDMVLRVNVWYPASEEAEINTILGTFSNDRDSQRAMLMSRKGEPSQTPPTYIRTNEFTEPWQEVIDTYGIPRYQEANPALLTVVTFPFIFGMMYGDVGHGGLLLLAGAFLCMKADTFKYSQPVLYKVRYMVLSLGIFATYAGFLYNDFFSVGLQLFDSRYEDPDGDGEWTPKFNARNEVGGGPGPYPFGIDWAWIGASNELLYLNSLKMKLSVLFGVLQMAVGVVLRWGNAAHDKNLTDFVFECVPMMVFLLAFFGWMDFMILYKWVNPVDNPPSIINSLICMAMGVMGQKDSNPLWPGSTDLAQTLMGYTFLAVPLMLFPKPFILLFQHRQQQRKKGARDFQLLPDEENGFHGGGSGHGHGHGHGEGFEFGEVFIHQIIETIEFVLGTVSHTASYLRIWALSLAHQQLSLVFFQKTLAMGLAMPFPANGIVLYFMFAAWFGVTLGVLLGMDVLECFLHTLRLHWVEFQSKFYKADGYKFEPFSIKALVSVSEDA